MTKHRIDLNAATAQDLAQVPGIGPVLAKRIVAHRDEVGPFLEPSQISSVSGIGETTYRAIAEHLAVVPPDELLSQVHEYATTLVTSVSPRSLRVIKRLVYEAQLESLSEAIDVANEEMIQSFRCNDFKEGVAHFVEKRPPKFTGE